MKVAAHARFIYCPNNVTVLTNNDRVAVWWRNPLVDVIVSSPPVAVLPNTSPGGLFTMGVTKVLYKTENADAMAAYCEFYITVISLGLSRQYFLTITLLYNLNSLRSCCVCGEVSCMTSQVQWQTFGIGNYSAQVSPEFISRLQQSLTNLHLTDRYYQLFIKTVTILFSVV